MEFVVRHYIPGRIRLNIPDLCAKRSLAEQALAWLSKQSGVLSARINYDCSSLVVEYEPAKERLLHDLIGRLRLMTPDELRMLMGLATAANGRQTVKPPGARPAPRLRSARRSPCRRCRCCSPSAPIRSSAWSICR